MESKRGVNGDGPLQNSTESDVQFINLLKTNGAFVNLKNSEKGRFETMEIHSAEIVHFVSKLIEICGLAVIVIGGVVSMFRFFENLRFKRPAFVGLRSDLGRSILLGLEFLVAGDIISTIAIEPTLESVAVLGVIVIIRTFLSFSLEVEINGRWPWQQESSMPGFERTNP